MSVPVLDSEAQEGTFFSLTVNVSHNKINLIVTSKEI
jgi:hypothetical protein